MEQKNKQKYLRIISEIANSWLYKLEASRELSYLKTRVPEKYINDFMFGFIPQNGSSFIDFMDEFGIITKDDPKKIFEELGLLYKYYKKTRTFFYNHSLLLPFFDVYGNVISIAGRTLSSDKKISKYKHIPFEKRYHLFGLNRTYKNIVRQNKAIIVEGQMDCISSIISGLNNTVALCGSKLTFEQIALLKRYTTNFYMLLDNDEAGISGVEKAKKQANKYGFNIVKLNIHDSNDIDDYCRVNNWNISLCDLLY